MPSNDFNIIPIAIGLGVIVVLYAIIMVMVLVLKEKKMKKNPKSKANQETETVQFAEEITEESGYIYIASNVKAFGKSVYKIGVTRKDNPMMAVKELSNESLPFDFHCHAVIWSDDVDTLKREIHSRLDGFRLNPINKRKEFFRISLKQIEDEVYDIDSTIKWEVSAR